MRRDGTQSQLPSHSARRVILVLRPAEFSSRISGDGPQNGPHRPVLSPTTKILNVLIHRRRCKTSKIEFPRTTAPQFLPCRSSLVIFNTCWMHSPGHGQRAQCVFDSSCTRVSENGSLLRNNAHQSHQVPAVHLQPRTLNPFASRHVRLGSRAGNGAFLGFGVDGPEGVEAARADVVRETCMSPRSA